MSSATKVQGDASMVSTCGLNKKEMFETFQTWALSNYGDSGKTKTVTRKKYKRIVKILNGEEASTAENSKFRFWVKAKGFRLGSPGVSYENNERNIVYVPTKQVTDSNSNAMDREYKRVAIVEDFFDIIYGIHVEMDGRGGKHAGQKRTYRAVGVVVLCVIMSAAIPGRLVARGPSHLFVAEEYPVYVPMLRPNQGLLQILKMVGAQHKSYTLDEISDYLRDYISSRKLYNAYNPVEVICSNDPLGGVFGVQKFTIKDALTLIRKSCYITEDAHIRHQLFTRPIPIGATNTRTATARQQGHNVSSVSSLSQVVSSSSPDMAGDVLPVQTVVQTAVQTPVQASTVQTPSQGIKRKASEDSPAENAKNSKHEFPWHFQMHVPTDESEVLNIQDVLVVCRDSDMEFWADSSGDESNNKLKDDDWSCEECNNKNSPLQRYCFRCWKLRPGWLPDHKVPSCPRRKRSKLHKSSAACNIELSSDSEGETGIIKRKKELSKDVDAVMVRRTFLNYQTKEVKSCEEEECTNDTKVKTVTSDPNVSSTSALSTTSALSSQPSSSNADCIICFSQPKTASLIHGSTGHQVCCYRCAKRLKRRKEPCPVCRKPIQKVIRNFLS